MRTTDNCCGAAGGDALFEDELSGAVHRTAGRTRQVLRKLTAAGPNAFESSAVDLAVGVTDAAVEQHAVRRGDIEQFKHFVICCVCSSFLGKVLQNEFNGTSAVRAGVRAGTDIMPALGTLD